MYELATYFEFADDLVNEWNEIVQLFGVGILQQTLDGDGNEGQDVVVEADDESMDELTHARVQRLSQQPSSQVTCKVSLQTRPCYSQPGGSFECTCTFRNH